MNRRLKHLRQEVAALLPGSAVRRARALYFRTAGNIESVYEQLDRARNASVRTRLLGNLAALEGVMGRESAAGWNTTAFSKRVTIGHNDASDILHILCSTEIATSPEFRNRGPEDWEDAFGDVLDELTAEPLALGRAQIMLRLYATAYATVGEDAAETIFRIATTYTRVARDAAVALADEEW